MFVPTPTPPGYQILLYFVEKYIGDSALALRFPSAVAGVLSILAIFLLGLRLYSYREGLIASAFMAVLWYPIFYSQEGRAYSLLLLFTLLATYFWILILESLNKRAKPLYSLTSGYIITAIISSYLHYFGLYLIALQGVGAVLFFSRKRQAWAYIFLIYFMILLAYLPWAPIMGEHISKGPTWAIPRPGNIIRTFIGYLHFLFNRSPALLSIVLILYLFLFRSLYSRLKPKGHKDIRSMPLSSDSLLILWLIVPFVGIYLKSILSTSILTYRNLIISLPPVYLLLSRSITHLPLSPRKQATVTFVIVSLFLSNLVFGQGYYSKPHKQEFRKAVNYIVEHEHLYEDSLIIGYAWHQDYFNYYFARKGSVARVNIISGRKEDIPDIAKIISVENPRYIWYIRVYWEPDAEFMTFLNKRFALIEHKIFYKSELWLFRNEQVE